MFVLQLCSQKQTALKETSKIFAFSIIAVYIWIVTHTPITIRITCMYFGKMASSPFQYFMSQHQVVRVACKFELFSVSYSTFCFQLQAAFARSIAKCFMATDQREWFSKSVLLTIKQIVTSTATATTTVYFDVGFLLIVFVLIGTHSCCWNTSCQFMWNSCLYFD